MNLRPFFGFYGGKWRDALWRFPPPEHSTLVEPFAGSAGYALRYPDRQVVLCDVDPVIAGVWRYLIDVSAEEIRALPDLAEGETTDDLRVAEEARWLIGFWLNRGVERPRRSPSKWMREGIRPGSFWGPRVRETIASQLEAIRHWQVTCCSYEQAPVGGAATWLIDPPYQGAGQHYCYGSSSIDYGHLADWVVRLPGQVIVCEQAGASWLAFDDAPIEVKTTRRGRRSPEVTAVLSARYPAQDG